MNIVNSLGTRLIALFIGLMLLILLGFSWFVSESSTQYQLQATQALHQDLATNMIKENQLLRDGKIDQTGLEQLFHSMMLLGPAFEIYVVGLKGDILAFSALEGKVKRHNIDVAPVTEFLRGQVSLPLLGDDPRHARVC